MSLVSPLLFLFPSFVSFGLSTTFRFFPTHLSISLRGPRMEYEKRIGPHPGGASTLKAKKWSFTRCRVRLEVSRKNKSQARYGHFPPTSPGEKTGATFIGGSSVVTRRTSPPPRIERCDPPKENQVPPLERLPRYCWRGGRPWEFFEGPSQILQFDRSVNTLPTQKKKRDAQLGFGVLFRPCQEDANTPPSPGRVGKKGQPPKKKKG